MRYIRRTTLWIAAAMLVAAGCSNSEREEPGNAAESHAAPAAASAGYAVIADNLRIPWSIQMSGDTFYVSEREGRIVRIDPDGTVSRKPVRTEADVLHQGEGGLLGLVLAPDFQDSKLAYVYHTYRESDQTRNRIIVIREEADEWVETSLLLDAIPGNAYHNGGRLAIGPDMHLYATTGDAWEQSLAQETNSLAGKILRMTLDGSVPADNPFPDSYVFSWGHRNPQGLDWNEAGLMYASEHGPSGQPGGHDEINRIDPGSNYGWPAVIGDERQAGMVEPLFHTGDTAFAPSGIAFDDSGLLLVATLRGEALLRFDPDDGTAATFFDGAGRLRDVLIRNDYAYVITNNTDGRGRPNSGDDCLIRLDLNGLE